MAWKEISIFLRCLIHFTNHKNKTIKESECRKTEVITEESFGKQGRDVKFNGLVYCESEEGFDEKLIDLTGKEL